jgi:hypothetical protein
MSLTKVLPVEPVPAAEWEATCACASASFTIAEAASMVPLRELHHNAINLSMQVQRDIAPLQLACMSYCCSVLAPLHTLLFLYAAQDRS